MAAGDETAVANRRAGASLERGHDGCGTAPHRRFITMRIRVVVAVSALLALAALLMSCVGGGHGGHH